MPGVPERMAGGAPGADATALIACTCAGRSPLFVRGALASTEKYDPVLQTDAMPAHTVEQTGALG